MTRRKFGETPWRVGIALAVICFVIVGGGGCSCACSAPAANGPGAILIRPADGMETAFVPAGEFLMGSAAADVKAGDDEWPQHTVALDAFWIDRTEVTNRQYARFLNVRGGHRGTCDGYDCVETIVEDEDSHILVHEGRYEVESGFEQHPVTEVTWYGAEAYCQWVGGRLPTEAEWEKAARGVDGRTYPWGDSTADCRRAQSGDCKGTTVPVGSKPAGASPYGAFDMAGNVWEWVADWYTETGYDSAPAVNPSGPDSGERKVFRGGSWGYPPTFLRTTERARNRPTYAGSNIGFRCVVGSSDWPATR